MYVYASEKERSLVIHQSEQVLRPLEDGHSYKLVQKTPFSYISTIIPTEAILSYWKDTGG